MSGPKLLPPKPKQAADNPPLSRLAEALEKLAGERWDQLGYGVAVSGGADSMALLDMMAKLLPRGVKAATVDHQLRTESSAEAAQVAGWCHEAGIVHHILTPRDPIAGSVQASARAARYALLEGWRQEQGLDYILTAHHADDQLETMVMRLNRASGVGGLAGIRAVQGSIMRPLLEWRRGELAQWANDHSLPVIDDPSNADPRFDRARLRQALAGQDWLDPRAVARSASWLDQADRALDWMAERVMSEWPDTGDIASIRDHDYPDELLRRIVERRLLAHQPSLALRGAALDSVITAMRAGQRAMIGDLLIDPVNPSNRSAWHISIAPRRNPRRR